MMKTLNKSLIAILSIIALLAAQSAQAKSSHSHEGYKSHGKSHSKNHDKRHDRNHHKKRYSHNKHYHHKSKHHHRYGAPWCPTHYVYHHHSGGSHLGHIIGGMALGAIITSAVKDNQIRNNRYEEQSHSAEISPPIIFRQTENGKCFQVFYNEKGDEYLTPVAKSNCGSY